MKEYCSFVASIMKKQLVLLASLIAACAAQGGPVIYNNGAPAATPAGYLSDKSSDTVIGGAESASNFVLGTDNIIADIHWWGSYGGNGDGLSADNFTIAIYENSGSSPGNVLHTIPIGAPGRTVLGGDLFSYGYDLSSPITLTSGVTYWLSILNDTTGDLGRDWYWQTASGFGNDQQRLLSNPGAWLPRTNEFAYTLTGPHSSVADAGSTLSLLGIALAGLAWCNRRRGASSDSPASG